MITWLNGRLCQADTASLSLQDRGFLLGDGLFETLLVCGQKPMHWTAHCNRLAASAKALKIPLDLCVLQDGVKTVLQDLIHDQAALRLTLTRGPSPRRGIGIGERCTPTLLITASAYAPPSRPFRALMSQHQRPPTLLSPYKTLNYLPSILALDEALSQDCDEAILTNANQELVCSTRGNIFVLKGSHLSTPPITSGALPGIMRAYVLEIASQVGLTITVAPLFHKEATQADAVFLTNSLMGIHPVASLDGTSYAGSAYLALLRKKLCE